MRFPQTQFRREDFSEVREDWMDRLLRPLNTQFKALQTILNNGIVFGDNVQGFMKEVTTSTGSSLFPVKFKNDLPGGRRPVSVMLASAIDITNNTVSIPVSAGNPAWATSGDQIVISDVTGLVAGRRYKLQLRVE